MNEKRAAVGYAPVDIAPPEATTPEAKAGYDPNQPRVPAGDEDGGQWTDGGGGGGSSSSGRLRVAQADTGTRNDAGEQEFSPSQRGWHAYSTRPNAICTAAQKCSREEVADQMSRYAVPGQDPSRPAEDNQIYFAWDPSTGLPGGFVKTRISSDGLTIVNRTLQLHILYDGLVERRASQAADGSWTVTTRGIGNNVIPGMNELNEKLGPEIFDALDQRLRENIEQHHGVTKSRSNLAASGSWVPPLGGVHVGVHDAE